MFFYDFNILDNFIKNNLIYNLDSEKNNLKKIYNLYNTKKIKLLETIDNMVQVTDSIKKNKLENFYETNTLLKKSLNNINEIENFTSKLNEDIDYIISLYNQDMQNNDNEIKACLVEYNKQKDELFNKILEFENTSTFALNATIQLFLDNNKTKINSTHTNMAKVNIETNLCDYNTLIISEKEQKAYLPFFYNEVKDIFENSNHNYKTMQDVVNELYVLPLNNFKNSSISRFRESFNLVRYKENGSIIKALDLGLELMFKYELSPIIIAACRNLDELDLYLDCLESNELNNFKCFEIKFDIMPKILKSKINPKC